jgi:hypothetical protein
MRKVVYVFTDGTKTTNYKEAIASGRTYKTVLEDIPKPHPRKKK